MGLAARGVMWIRLHPGASLPAGGKRALGGSPPTLVDEGVVGGGHEGRALDGRDHLARALHAVNALLAGIGAELSDVPRRVGHARVVQDLGDGRQAVPVARAQHVLVDDAPGLAHLEEVWSMTGKGG